MRLKDILRENDQALSVIRQAGLSALPDNDQWTHRFEIHSASSSRVYVIAKRKSNGEWGCGCPAWRTRRHCKHLDSIRNVTSKIDAIDGISTTINKAAPVEPKPGDLSSKIKRVPKSQKAIDAAKERSKRSFSDDAYNHYDTSKGFGSAQEWMNLANDKFSHINERPGDSEKFNDGRHTTKREALLHAIGTDKLPKTLADLKSIARRKLMATHPDTGGSADDFRKVYAAYEALALDLFNTRI